MIKPLTVVETENSTYVIDRASRTVTRLPHHGTGSLRRDCEPVTYIEIGEAAVGQSLRMVLDLRRDGTPTLRTTSAVVSVYEQEA